jgi:hypothetical protein
MSLVHLILGAAAVLAAVYVVSLCLSVVFDYLENLISNLKSRYGNKRINKDCVGVMVRERLNSGEFNVISGVFDQTSNTLVEANAWETGKLERDIENEFRGDDCVTYTIT